MFCAAAISVHSIHSTVPLSWGKGGLLSQYDTKMLPHVHNSFTIAEAVSAMMVQVRLSHCEYPIFGRHGGNLMNNFWKRKVPAFLLTLVMLASLAPAALADCAHNNWGPWITQTKSTCLVPGKEHRCFYRSRREGSCGPPIPGLSPASRYNRYIYAVPCQEPNR